MRQVALCGFLLFISHLPGCQPAGRYKALESPEKKNETQENISPSQAWMKPKPAAFDLPILFIPDSNPEWAQLPAFWNHFPPPPAGLPTCHLGQTPLGALSAMVLAAQGEA